MWQAFLNSLDSAGGHILVLCVGVGLGVALVRLGAPDGHTVLAGAGGALLVYLRQKAA